MIQLFSIIGDIPQPSHLAGYGGVAPGIGSGGGGGLIGLASNLVRLLIVVGGLWAFINLLMAGLLYIIYGDNAQELAKVHSKIYMSLIGLIVMVSSFVIAGIVSWILYGNFTTILSPIITGPNG